MSVYEKLMNVQSELKAPKGQFNSFGKYKYRSCEDILEAAKPVLGKHKAVIVLSDTIEVNADRVYVKASATFIDVETGDCVQNTAYAREDAEKKGMDASQITGTASSYARKYALNGLLLIDDTKDADTDEAHNEKESRSARVEKGKAKNPDFQSSSKIGEKEKQILTNMCERLGHKVEEIFPKGLDLTSEQYTQAIAKLKGLGA